MIAETDPKNGSNDGSTEYMSKPTKDKALMLSIMEVVSMAECCWTGEGIFTPRVPDLIQVRPGYGV